MREGSRSQIMDLEDRDPNNLNQHLQVVWDDVIGEPEGVRSPECAWRLTEQCFKVSKNCCYVFLTVLFAPVAGLCLGCGFACLAFQHIWCVAPCLRVWKISCGACRIICASCAQAVVAPCTEALGYFWSKVKVRHHTLPDGPDHVQDVLIL
ncbi:caveolin-3-like [Ctenocephalides felis]|uniref:caveolin-3-like n=1 Tax=Ctenocephalides felis TaxID=7515 RepID=UPI000E6E26D6|nr:caveolin-3-like [Ctenocephalides felis]XP_026471886.1 caveolin-3-like [Ctenocephalides felis]